MPSHIIERPKMTKTTYHALKKHIMHEKRRKKQAEQEQDEALKRIRKEREMRKKKEEEDTLTLEQTIQQIQELEKHMENLKQEKHQLFTQLKSVLHHEDTRKKVQTKENSADVFPLAQQFHPNYPPVLMPAHLQNKRYMAVNTPSGVKRTRTPSPPPALSAAAYYAPPAKYSTQYPAGMRQPEPYSNLKPMGHLAPVQSTHVTYSSSQSPLAYHQPMGNQTSQSSIINLPHGAAMSPHYMKSQAGATQFAPPPHSYPNASQSAFSSYPAHYIQQQQQQQQQQRPPSNVEFQIHRLAQPNYFSQSMAVAALQQQLEHAASQKASSRQLAGLQQAPPGNIMALPPQQSPAPKGSIVTGYPLRPPAGNTLYQNIPGSSQSALGIGAKHPFGNQNLPKYSK